MATAFVVVDLESKSQLNHITLIKGSIDQHLTQQLFPQIRSDNHFIINYVC